MLELNLAGRYLSFVDGLIQMEPMDVLEAVLDHRVIVLQASTQPVVQCEPTHVQSLLVYIKDHVVPGRVYAVTAQ